MPPVAPMLAKSVADDPARRTFFEPKWDGFRSIVFRDGDEVELGSRNEQPMTRYFPEVVEARAGEPARALRASTARSSSPRRRTGSTSRRCSSASTRPPAGSSCSPSETPARFVAFDLLALGDDDLTARPFAERRAALERRAGRRRGRRSTSRRPPTDRDVAQRLVRRSSRAPGSTASSPSRSTAPTSRTSA